MSEVRYFAVFTDDGHRAFTLVADGMPMSAADVLQAYPRAVEVTAEEQAQLMNGWTRAASGRLVPPADDRVLEDVRRHLLDEVERREARALALTVDQVLECMERGEPVPTALRAERADLRSQAAAMRQAIGEASTLAQLDAVSIVFTGTGQGE